MKVPTTTTTRPTTIPYSASLTTLHYTIATHVTPLTKTGDSVAEDPRKTTIDDPETPVRPPWRSVLLTHVKLGYLDYQYDLGLCRLI
jgi:hypothetical protein